MFCHDADMPALIYFWDTFLQIRQDKTRQDRQDNIYFVKEKKKILLGDTDLNWGKIKKTTTVQVSPKKDNLSLGNL